jgi:hypothetical protein
VSFASAIKGRTDVEQPHEVHQTALKQVIRALRYSAGISGALLTTRLGEPLTIGQFLIPATPRVAQGAPPFPRCSDEFNAMPDMQSPVASVFATVRRGAPVSQCDQRRSGRALLPTNSGIVRIDQYHGENNEVSELSVLRHKEGAH